MMEDESVEKLTKGDSIRGLLGALATLIAVSLALSPRLPGYGPGRQIAVVVTFGLIAVICVWTSKSRWGVALGILLIVAFRFLIAGVSYVAGGHGRH